MEVMNQINSNMSLQWDQKSSIRSKPRRLLDISECDAHFFPISRQPIAIHPLVTDLGEKAVQFILLQTAYRYMYEIALLELEMVNNVSLKIALNHYPYLFSQEQRNSAMTIIIDEAYHAYVAFDFIQQAENITKVKMQVTPEETPVSRSLKKFADQHFELLQLVSICLSEHVLTKDLVYLKHEQDTCKFFIDIMQDHLLDEGRHASYFATILTTIWQQINDEDKVTVSSYLPCFIDEYINQDAIKQYDRIILTSLNFKPEVIDEILYDSYFTLDKNQDPNVKNFMAVLKSTGLLDDNLIRNKLLDYQFRLANF